MPTQQILTYDNSRIKTYKKCPREFQLSHILYWAANKDAPALVFGGAYHEGMAKIFELKDKLPKADLLNAAMLAFDAEWEKRNGPTTDEGLEMWFPRIPSVAATMLSNWLDKYKHWLSKIEVLEIEEPFAVPLFSRHQCPYCMEHLSESYWENNKYCLHCHAPLTETMLIGRRDLVYKEGSKKYCFDTKTSSMYVKIGGFQRSFVDSFHIDSQIDGYYYTTIMTHGSCEAVVINACMTKKDHWDVFDMYPQYRDFNSLYQWYSETCLYVNRILSDLAKGSQMFTRNPESCQTRFGSCKFHDICRVIHEPHKEIAQPIGFKIEKWEPFDEEELKALIMKTQEAARVEDTRPICV